MKPIAIFQHTEVGAPGSITDILKSLGMPYTILRIVDGEPVPERADDFAGLIFMGGYMGVHDAYSWIPSELSLIRQADALNIPVAGHCLGSQLLAVALGGRVMKNHCAEIGWHHLKVANNDVAEKWWGHSAGASLLTFQWHADTFEPPPGAISIASSAHCLNQAFVVRDLHIGVQSHLEMTPELVELSLQRNGAQLVREHQHGNVAVTTLDETRQDLVARTRCLQSTLAHLYQRWIVNVERISRS